MSSSAPLPCVWSPRASAAVACLNDSSSAKPQELAHFCFLAVTAPKMTHTLWLHGPYPPSLRKPTSGSRLPLKGCFRAGSTNSN
ncbi:hypothetical protein NDU88_003982 [Pleurodeles waltl]|uniref:Secreted protein n=1 Tax=Pleurodeles waltl TaxID=8319 RepID=A0AAV7M7V8_PLEWA|nr:hypothetical protein NDU88_003982 [Pleurodeles waltl]